MSISRYAFLVLALAATLLAGDDLWKSKAIADWNEDDAKAVLDDSPWSKHLTPGVTRQNQTQQRPMGRQGGYGRGGGIGIGMGGIGIGMPRYPGGGGGYPGGGGGYPNGGGNYPNGNGYPDDRDPNGTYGQNGRNGGRNGDPGQAPELTLRWESANPVRAAHLKTQDVVTPQIDDSHYAIAVYGFQDRHVQQTSKFTDEVKKQTQLRRDGKKDVKPSAVQVFDRPDGPVLVFLFPRSNEFTAQDRRVEFHTIVGRFEFSQSFYLDEMVFQGKAEY